MTTVLSKQIPFDVQLTWLGRTDAILSSKEAEGQLKVSSPPQFGGEGRPWTPEHLFLASINSCYMSTFLAIANKMKISLSGFECSAHGEICTEQGQFKFEKINLSSRVYLLDGADCPKVKIALSKTKKHCIITKSINTELTYQDELFIDEKTMNECQ